MNQNITFSDIIFSLGSIPIKLLKLLDFFIGNLLRFIIPVSPEIILDEKSINRMLVIRPGGMGDAIFLIPLLRKIKEVYPHIKIDILGEKRNIQCFTLQKNILNNTFCYDNLSDFSSILKNNYDVIFDTEQRHSLSAITASRIKSKCRIGFGTTPLRRKIFNQVVAYGFDEYELINFQNLFSAVFKLSYPKDINQSFLISQQSQDWAAQKIPTGSVSLFLGASIPLRRFTKEQSLDIIRYLTAKKIPVVLLGGSDILKDTESLIKEISNPLVYNFAGNSTLEESAALIKHSRLFIGTDSGLMHLACAVGTPVVAVFGPGNLKKWEPRGEKHQVVSEYVSCSPCTRFGYTVPTCKGSYHCMKQLDIHKIKNVLAVILSK